MNENAELFRKGWSILNDRDIWEARQRKWYIMRHEGLRRRNKPFPTAADLHLKLIDEKVNQKKAFTMATVLGQPRLSQFVSLKAQPTEFTESAADFFTYEIKEKTNFLRVLLTCVDTMWLRGRGVIKCFVDPFDDYKIINEAVDPLYLLMPDDCNDFDDAYEWVHVRQMNIKQFKNDRRFCLEYRNDDGEVDGKTIDKLKGGAEAAARLATQRGVNFELIQEDKELREGYTHSPRSDTVIIWEHYVRTMGGCMVYYYCPSALDVEIRKPHGVPYKVDGRISAPYFSFQAEVKDEGWYSPRGVAEKIADNEIYGCKVWNAKADAMTFYGTPQYISDVGVQNPANYRVAPGEVLPPGIRPAPLGSPPIAFDQEINFARAEAEMATASVDSAVEKPNQRGYEKRTKKEVEVASSIAQIGQNLENFTFKEDLARVYRHQWGLILQFKRKQLAFFVGDDLKTVPEEALHEEYAISAGSGTDDWDKAQRVTKAQGRYQLLVGKPNIDQDNLVTDLLQADDARLVKKLVVPQNQKAATEAEDENTEINDMCPGPGRPSFPIPVLPGQDHATRAMTILKWIEAAGVMGTPTSPAEKQRLFQHLQQHMQALKETDPKAYQKIAMEIKKAEMKPARPQVSAPMPAQAPRRAMRPVPAKGKFAMI